VNITALGHEFVVFRGNSGEAHVMDGFSAHLGANLGVGGKVVEVYGYDCIRCLFHGWTLAQRNIQSCI
jgi:cholesterol 7-dehydrogenase